MSDEATMGDRGAGTGPERAVGRRAVLCGTGAVGAALGAGLLTGCGPSNKAAEAKDLKGKEIGKVADVPVGGGKVYADSKIVVTQPSQGVFKAFSAVCTHQGCLTNRVSGGKVHCPCHGSEFQIADGSVAHGPANKALTEYPVQIKGDAIFIA
ncbi:Rieske (2Fe-2S) protein [Actinomadura rupiterrae]|uniref:Rieske (2Fe-2S) protein n=1 Tax=Actinomadura rupiterrae TaxID=559627 RepID=UPI0020A5787A|nr:Rieske (2Fe-2S) protein [Actinomadura rupiterrae]MCP2341196.1 nitrite reductase/ring-hydroxylating ferredoxin subunit [Actinomadura rupiterrae]